jgi:uncharacterized membrane protein (DUF4010 family)
MITILLTPHLLNPHADILDEQRFSSSLKIFVRAVAVVAPVMTRRIAAAAAIVPATSPSATVPIIAALVARIVALAVAAWESDSDCQFSIEREKCFIFRF